jgi:hypothetical protein
MVSRPRAPKCWLRSEIATCSAHEPSRSDPSRGGRRLDCARLDGMGGAALLPIGLRASTLTGIVSRGLDTASMDEERRHARTYLFRRARRARQEDRRGGGVQLGSGEVFKAQIPGPPVEAIEWMQTLPGPVRAVYEAGPTGFGLARAARAAGIEMMVCAPGAIPPSTR